MLFEKKTSPVVLRDGPDILAAVRTALAQVTAGDSPRSRHIQV